MEVRAMNAFRRFDVAGRVDLGPEAIVSRLEKRKFLPLDGAVEETERFGWVTLEHLLDTRFEPEKVVRDPYVLFALRIDRRRVPPAIARAHLAIREGAWRDATGKKVSAGVRRKLREEVRAELMRKIMPSARAYQVVWKPAGGAIWFGSTSEQACEAFARQFEDTFGAKVVPGTPRNLALRLLAGDADAVERTAPASFSKQEAGFRLAAAR